jgi:hypothetical protein
LPFFYESGELSKKMLEDNICKSMELIQHMSQRKLHSEAILDKGFGRQSAGCGEWKVTETAHSITVSG